jgi:hypothetical protein
MLAFWILFSPLALGRSTLPCRADPTSNALTSLSRRDEWAAAELIDEAAAQFKY